MKTKRWRVASFAVCVWEGNDKMYNKAQIDWSRRMWANLDDLRTQYHNSRTPDSGLLSETDRKIREAVRRLRLVVTDQEEFAASNEWWDGEEDGLIMWLRYCLSEIERHCGYVHDDQPDDPEPDFERLYELEMDRRYHQFHGNVPDWAQ